MNKSICKIRELSENFSTRFEINTSDGGARFRALLAQPPAFTLRKTSFWSIETVNANGIRDLRLALSPHLRFESTALCAARYDETHSTIPRAPPICGDTLRFSPYFLVCFLFLSLLTLFIHATTVTISIIFSKDNTGKILTIST